MDTQKRISKLNYTLNPILLTSEQKHSWYIVVDTLYGYTGSQYVNETRNVTLDNIALLVNGIVPAHMLPSYVDDLIFGTYDNASDIFTGVDDSTSETIYYHHPATSEQTEPESGKIYCDTSTGVQYRYSGTAVNTKYFISIPNSYTYSSGNGITISEAVYGVKEISISDTYDASVVHISGQETILNGKGFSKGALFYGQDTFPTNVGNYVTLYNSTVYGCRVLAYNGTTYQQLNLGAMPTTNKFALSLLANGNSSIGYNVDLYNTTHSNQYGVITKNNIRFLHDFNYGNNGTITTDGFNLFIGPNAGNFTMGSTANTSSLASYNIGIGNQVLYNNTTGYMNTVIGNQVLYNNITGGLNTGLGYKALYSNTTGSSNIGIGYYSLYSGTNGHGDCIGIGNEALYSNNDSYNIGIGNQSLKNHTIGSNNIAIGSSALYNNISGTKNISIGISSGYNCTGSYDIILGYNAGINITGDYDTIIGANAGNTITSGSGILVLGYGAEPLNPTDVNEIIIKSGNDISNYGNGSNTVTIGNSSMNYTYLYGVIQLQNYIDGTLPTLVNSGGVYYNSTQKHIYGYIDGLSTQLDNFWTYVTTSAQLLTALQSYYINNIWIANDITLVLDSTSLYIRSPYGKIIDGNGKLTIVGDSVNTTCNIFGSTDPTSLDVGYMGNAVIDFKCKTEITQYFRCHESTFWFRRCTSTTISSSVLYGIWADSAATIHYGFSDNGYVGIWPDGVGDILIFEGNEGKIFYESSVTQVSITTSQTIRPAPNFIYKITDPANDGITLTILPPIQENYQTSYNMQFSLYFDIECGMDSFISIPDPSGTSATVRLKNGTYGIYGNIDIVQLGSGYKVPMHYIQ